MQKCPNCRAAFKGGAVCHRCGCELELLVRIEHRAEALERLAVQCLQTDPAVADFAARRALAMQHRPLAAALRGFIAYLDKRRR